MRTSKLTPVSHPTALKLVHIRTERCFVAGEGLSETHSAAAWEVVKRGAPAADRWTLVTEGSEVPRTSRFAPKAHRQQRRWPRIS